MAGDGETQSPLGISLSKGLIEYVVEMEEACSRVERIGNEVFTTCERPKELGNRAEQANADLQRRGH